MTISLEEHVARAIFRTLFHPDENGDTIEKKWLEWDHERKQTLSAARAAIAAVREREGALTKDERRQFAINFIHEGQRPADPAEAMRAKTLDECEAIARAYDLGTPEGAAIADSIAALKDNGERKPSADREWTLACQNARAAERGE